MRSDMDRIRNHFLIPVFVASFFAIILLNGSEVRSQKPKVHFIWAFGALVGSEQDPDLIAIDRKTVLQSGDQIKFYVELLEDCYVYLFYYSSQGDLILLFPFQGDEDAGQLHRKYNIPEGDAWFRLDNAVGKEKFYLIASVRRLRALEKRYAEHIRLKQSTAMQSSALGILDEIKKIKQKNRTLTAPAEKPVRLGGNFRGAQKAPETRKYDVFEIAREISAEDFYSRTFTIDHR